MNIISHSSSCVKSLCFEIYFEYLEDQIHHQEDYKSSSLDRETIKWSKLSLSLMKTHLCACHGASSINHDNWNLFRDWKYQNQVKRRIRVKWRKHKNEVKKWIRMTFGKKSWVFFFYKSNRVVDWSPWDTRHDAWE